VLALGEISGRPGVAGGRTKSCADAAIFKSADVTMFMTGSSGGGIAEEAEEGFSILGEEIAERAGVPMRRLVTGHQSLGFGRFWNDGFGMGPVGSVGSNHDL